MVRTGSSRLKTLKFMILRLLRALTRTAAAFYMAANAQYLCAADHDRITTFNMHFLTNSAGDTLVRQGEMAPAKLTVGKGKEVNVSQLSTNKGAQYSLVPDNSYLAISSEQFAGWLAEVPPRQSFSFGFNYPQGRLDVATSDLNDARIPLTFSDGARVEMLGRAEGRLEVMNDGTYAFFGAGPITGTTADGVAIRFGHVFPPLFGGKLTAPKTTNANARFSRASPVTQVTFIGQIGSELKAKVGEKTVPLVAGAAQNITAENGGNLSLLFDAKTRSVEWSVTKGLFRFTVDSFNCWKALGASGQKAAMQWDTNGFMMEIKNKNGPDAFQRTVLVNLNPALNVAVGDSATFQYGRTGDCSTFVTSAHGGETTLYNSQTGRFIRLDEGNMNVISGTPDHILAEALSLPHAKIKIAWGAEGNLEIKGVGDAVQVPINGEATFQAGVNQELQVAYHGNDDIVLTARSGNFSVTPELLPNISVEISEGAGVTVGYDPRSDILQVRPLISNVSPVAIRTATGFYPRIDPGTRLTFVINRSTFVADGSEGTLIFSETAGAATPQISGGISIPQLLTGGGSVTFFGGASQNLNQPRVEQPPVTTLE
jgi:hypothetical protein